MNLIEKITPISALKPGAKVIIGGFIEKIRVLGKKLKFLVIRDYSGKIQVVLKHGVSRGMHQKFTPESVVLVIGNVVEHNGKREILATNILILSKAEPVPIDLSGGISTSLSKRLDHRPLDLRRYRNLVIFRILSDFLKYTREYFYKEGLMEIFTPKITGAVSESGAETFELEYFGKKAYLIQSAQFYKQMAAIAFGKVFEIGPVFRANPSFTSRHDTEFTMLDVEMSFTTWKQLMKFEERWLAYAIKKLKEKYEEDVRREFGREIEVPRVPFPRLKFEEAYELLKSDERFSEYFEGVDLTSKGEKAIGRLVKEEYDSEFVFLTEYPFEVRPFYHMKLGEDKTMSFDLLWNGVEVTTGSQREHRYEVLLAQVREKGLNVKPLEFYLEIFKYGAPPHAGFGLSPSRSIMCLLGLGNVREATLFPRDPNRIFP